MRQKRSLQVDMVPAFGLAPNTTDRQLQCVRAKPSPRQGSEITIVLASRDSLPHHTYVAMLPSDPLPELVNVAALVCSKVNYMVVDPAVYGYTDEHGNGRGKRTEDLIQETRAEHEINYRDEGGDRTHDFRFAVGGLNHLATPS